MEKNSELQTARIELSVGGEPRILELHYPAKPVKLRRMLPVFQKATDYFVNLGIEKSKAENREISCRTGCAACCRQPVPISESEAYLLRGLIEEMPEPDKTNVMKRFNEAFDHFEKIGWFEKVREIFLIKDRKSRKKRRDELARKYFTEDVPCPFLKDESCSIYKNRPLTCREYLVTSPAEYCADPFTDGDKIKPVEIGLKPSQAIYKMAVRQKDGQEINFVPLVALLKWTDEFSESKEMKTGGKWVQDFFGLLAPKKMGNQ